MGANNPLDLRGNSNEQRIDNTTTLNFKAEENYSSDVQYFSMPKEAPFEKNNQKHFTATICNVASLNILCACGIECAKT